MSVMLIRGKVKPECVVDAEAAAAKLFATLAEERPAGVRYASCKLPDGVTFVAILEIEKGVDNPLPAIPAFTEFQERLKDWLAEPSVVEPATVVGTYRLFG